MKIEYVSEEREVEQFIRFAWDVYKDNPFWVPPGITETKNFLMGKGRFFDHCQHQLFLVREKKQIVATVAAFYDKHLVSHWGKRVGFLGYFEALPNKMRQVEALLTQAELFLKHQGAEEIQAPVNGSIANPAGLLTNAFNQMPVFLMPYNPSYYIQYLSRLGFRPVQELVAYTVDLLDGRLQRKISYVVRRAQKSKLKIRRFSKEAFDRDSVQLGKLYAQTFNAHWGYAPQSDDEVREMLSPFKLAFDTDFILFAEYDGEPVGFILGVPDYNPLFRKLNGNFDFLNTLSFIYLKKRIREGRLIAMGVLADWRGKHVAPLLVASAYDAMIQKGYTKCEYSWVVRENVSSRNVAKQFYSDEYKRYMIYERSLLKRGNVQA